MTRKRRKPKTLVPGHGEWTEFNYRLSPVLWIGSTVKLVKPRAPRRKRRK